MLLDPALLVAGPGSASDQCAKGAANQCPFAGVVGSCRPNASADRAANKTIGGLLVIRRLHVALHHVSGILLASELVGVECSRRFVGPRHHGNHRSRRRRRAGCEQQQRRSHKDTRMNAFHDRTSVVT